MTTPEETVRAFIGAYDLWNQQSFKHRNFEVASREYGELIARFCSSTVIPQNVSFGNDSSHDPARETIESVRVDGQAATVCSCHVGKFNFVSNFTYFLVFEMGEWRIASLKYVAGGSEYECL